ncbi:hypothetical protein [Blastopirellula marina]|uniref:Uncharacterized protein n=1 Tax=Blastopirellula marina TaxID=124 RepID=A0A2S8GR88_9BACT|nr:hypothetical protein [Blastopirellula marina]PQO46949.1 hypothetical protein C5Y93_07305 [Blastopirellula marina]
MSQLEPPPSRQDEAEEIDWPESSPPPQDRPVEASAFRFSVTRLILATLVAVLPMLMFRRDLARYGGWYLTACVCLFVASLLIRARDLPRINVTLSLMLLVSLIFGGDRGAAPWLGAVMILPASFIGHCIYPAKVDGKPYVFGCDAVIASSLLLYVALNFLFLFIASIMIHQGKTAIALSIVVGTATLLITNVILIFLDPRKNLDERPDLGYRYEATMVLLPLAILFLMRRVIP